MNMKHTSALAIVALLISGCDSSSSNEEASYQPQFDVVMSDQARVIADPTSSDFHEFIQTNNAFGLSLFAEVAQQESDNLVFSPYSISAVMGMLYAGAREESASQLAQALNFSADPEHVHHGFNTLSQVLESRNRVIAPNYGVELDTANVLWMDERQSFHTDYLDTLAAYYGAGVHLSDFVTAPEASLKEINQWVSHRTKGLIDPLLQEGQINPDTAKVLVNAVYLNASWRNPFDEENTADGTFHLNSGEQLSTPMMHKVKDMGYVDMPEYTAIRIPYAGHDLSMLVVIPDTGVYSWVEESFTVEFINQVRDAMESRTVDLKLPKFAFSSQMALQSFFQSRGMENLFNPALADLSGINGGYDLFLSAVQHMAAIDVREQGTIAAAATAAIVSATSAPVVEEVVTVNRPFMFAIQDDATGAILFLGRVLDPTAD